MDLAPMILFAQNRGGGEAIGNLVGLCCQLIVYGAILAFAVYYLIVIFKTLSAISPSNREMEPGMVFLIFIPVPFFGVVWYFFIVLRLAESLRKEFKDRGLSGDGDYGKQTGMTAAIASCFCCVIVSLPAAIMHMIKCQGYLARLEGKGKKKKRVMDDDDDYDDDEDDRPRRKRRRDEDDDD